MRSISNRKLSLILLILSLSFSFEVGAKNNSSLLLKSTFFNLNHLSEYSFIDCCQNGHQNVSVKKDMLLIDGYKNVTSIKLFSEKGRVWTISKSAKKIYLGHLSTGLYTLVITTEDGVYTTSIRQQ